MRPIDADEVSTLVSKGGKAVEVLPAEEFQEEHLPNAINIPLKELDAARVAQLQRDQPVIVYCHDYQ